jgi:hypothetical protein
MTVLEYVLTLNMVEAALLSYCEIITDYVTQYRFSRLYFKSVKMFSTVI